MTTGILRLTLVVNEFSACGHILCHGKCGAGPPVDGSETGG